MRKYVACILAVLLLACAPGVAQAADTWPEDTLYYDPLISVEPGLAVTPGTRLTLTLLPQSFPYNPDLDLERDGVDITWYLDLHNDNIIELGHGMSCVTMPMEISYNYGVIHAVATLNRNHSTFRELYDYDNTWLELDVATPAAADPDAHMGSLEMDGKQNLDFVTAGDMYWLQTWMEANGKTIAGQAPWDDTGYLRGGVSFDWRETDAQGTPVTGCLGSGDWFIPPTTVSGTRYYICRGYYNQHQVAGEARFIVRTVEVPEFRLSASPHILNLGDSVTITTTYQDQIVDPEGAATRSQLEVWLTGQTGDQTAALGEISGHTYLTLRDDDDEEDPEGNPAHIDNLTEKYAWADLIYELTASYHTDQYFGTLYWRTPMVLLHIEDGGDGPPADDYLTLSDVFADAAHLTQQALAERIRNDLETLSAIEVYRGGSLLEPAAWCATNDQLIILDSAGNEIGENILVLRGDVLGTGTMNISQLVRVAQALTGQRALEGAYFEAGDFNGSGSIDIGDLTAVAALLRSAQQ